MYDNRPVTPGAHIRIDDDASLMLTRELRKGGGLTATFRS
jgi:hypothetical protein